MSREIDARIATVLFGWTNVAPDCYVHDGKDWCGTDPSGTGGYYGTRRKIVPHYSTDIARAWEVVEKLRAQNLGMETSIYPDGKAECWILKKYSSPYYEHTCHTGIVDSAPLAICMAALEIVEDDPA